MKLLSFTRVALALLAPLFAVACASTPDGAPTSNEPSADSTEDEIRASCTNPREYFATFRDGTPARDVCKPIAGQNGQWLPAPLFANAPKDVQAMTCTYRWSGQKYSRPDGDAIRATIGWANGLAASCGSSSEPDVGAVQPIPKLDDWGKSVGSVGCDVCGVLKNGNIFVVLPAERVQRRQFEVGLSTGETQAFQIQPTNARALTIKLPALPAGTTYKQGRVPIL